ncbi:MAG: CCA tRNA nucleotidyltransferase, partial [Kiritimatiellae bacterium]|nr:CCA tRNA nucleotidyltransferase [Kiritimatiellia bacterium]
MAERQVIGKGLSGMLDLSVLQADLREAVVSIALLARQNGGRAFMVGGSVRDLLAGSKHVKDVDVEVFGIPPERLQRIVGERFAFDPCGVSFGVLKLHHLDVDVAIPRRETKRGTGHKGFLIDSDSGLSVREAAERRDFTLNALYYDPLEDLLEDPYGGVSDLQNRVLRHVSGKFAEDPLRVLRGMQFVARFDLSPAPETVEICRTIDMEGLPPERLFDEWGKLLTKGVRIGKGLAFLRATGWVRFFPELAR